MPKMSTENKPHKNAVSKSRLVGREKDHGRLKPGFVRVGENKEMDFDLFAQFGLPSKEHERWIPLFQVVASDHYGRTIGHALVGSTLEIEEYESVMEVLACYCAPGFDVTTPLLWQCRLSALVRDVDVLRCSVESPETCADIAESGWRRIGGGTSFVRLTDYDELVLLKNIVRR